MSILDGPTLHVSGHIITSTRHEVADLWVHHGRIGRTRPSAPGTRQVELSGWVLPGLVDVHSHIGLGRSGPTDVATAQAQAVADRDSGVLLIRDAGSPMDTTWVQHRPDLPRLIRSGRHLALPKRYQRFYAQELDDARQLPEAVRHQARHGDGWVKLVGDWIDRSLGVDADLRPLWPRDVLIDAVAAAHGEAARVTMHAFTHEAVQDALVAGVDCIEHGTGIRPELMGELATRGIPVTATALQVSQFADIAARADGKYPVYAAHMRAMHARRHEQIHALYDAGVQLLVGTDAGGTIAHGRIADECAELVAAGIPAAEVVADASWRARDFLGFASLSHGASADFVVYSADPRADIEVLRRPTAIVLRGQIVSPPLVRARTH